MSDQTKYSEDVPGDKAGIVAGEIGGNPGRTAPETPEVPHDFPHGFTHRPGRWVSRKALREYEWERLCVAFEYRCAYCGVKPPILYRDHAFPKIRGGGDDLENILPSCSGCNTRKGTRTPLEWFLGVPNPKPPRRVWPASDQPCRRCGGSCERRQYGKGEFYDRCAKCRWENPHVPQVSRVPSTPERGSAA